MLAYAPPRTLAAKVKRRLTQWRAARPVVLRFDEPILSICFDDFPRSAAHEGAAILARHGARGTYYAAADMADKDGPCGQGFSAADIVRLAEAGHEIGCHTFSHADCATRDAFDTLTDIAANRDALRAMGLTHAPVALAYPYGESTNELKDALPPRMRSARGVLRGLNVGRADLAQLRAAPLFGAGALSAAYDALRQAAKRTAWLIAFTHDVSDTPSAWGTSGADLDLFLSAARKLGFHILPVTSALERARP
ncbi:polysaccharide deacetylase [alpha proteobacterium U9-1i]|nr:polysaccharide deacetylase [alpha proteobacterium U9-1i]